jgi:hypothetical protein
LHEVLRTHLATFLSEREQAGSPLPRFVKKELEKYVTCGVLSAGCARLSCEKCGLDRLTALSCKGRAWTARAFGVLVTGAGIGQLRGLWSASPRPISPPPCPRCCGRRMTKQARHLAERVFPAGVRVRQWVLSLPFDLRIRLAFHHDLVLALIRLANEEIGRRYRDLALSAGLANPRGGSVTAIHRASGDLRLNVHPHGLFLDGAYGSDDKGQLHFHRAPAPSPAEVSTILERIVTRARALLSLGDQEDDALDGQDLGLAQAYAAAASATGTGKHAPEEETDGFVELPTRRKAKSTASTSTPKSLCASTTARGSSTWPPTSCARRSPSTA